MPASDLPAVLWRRRRTLVATFAACFVGVLVVTVLLPKRYDATATILVGGAGPVPSDQVLRSFSALAGNPNTAEAVRGELPFRISRSKLLSRMSFTPVDQTQLFEITARAPSAGEAKQVANIYAAVFTSRAGDRLTDVPGRQTVTVSEAASLPTSAAEPDVPVYLGLGALLSLILALGAVALRELLNPRLSIPPRATAVLDAPLLARVPADADDGTLADAARLLKTNIDLADDRPPRVVAVTSASGQEGRSTIAALLAAAHAEGGARTVLVEADFQRPGLQIDGLDRSATGLSDYFAGAAIGDVITAHPEVQGLDVIWAGERSNGDPGMPGSERLNVLMRVLLSSYDYVVLDTPPVAGGADASLLAASADGAVVVVDAERTNPADARVGLAQLHNVRARVLGVVVNRAERERPRE